MDLKPEALELAEFDSVDDGGFDPEQVRELLRAAAERVRELERDGVLGVGNSVGAVLEQATATGKELIEKAHADAEAIRSAAQTDAARITEDATEAAAEKMADAEARVDGILAEAQTQARERAATVISDAQHRLDRLLAAERDVHHRLRTAISDIQASVGRVGVDQDAELALTIDGASSTDADADGQPARKSA